MQSKRYRYIVRNVFAVVGLLCLSSAVAYGQEERGSTPSSTSPSETEGQVRALSELIRDLQAQVQTLKSQLGDLRTEQQRASEEARVLRQELNLAKAQMVPAAGGPANLYSTAVAGVSNAQPAVRPSLAAPQEPTASDRIAKLEENQEVTDAKVNDQYQTKLESGSKYRLRLSGMVLLNLYENRGLVDNQDFPQLAQPPQSAALFVSPGSFGGSLRQSQVKLEAFGPDLAGARTSANVEFDFAGGFPNTWNGTVQGLVRLRTGTVRLDWGNTSVVAGQDGLFFAPLAPTSLATLATPALSYSGNLWAWTPQVRVEHRIRFSDTSNVELQAGILDSLTGDFPQTSTYRYPSWGEESGQPAYATRISWNQRAFGQNLAIGFGGYYARQNWGFSRIVNGWAGTTDVTLPLGKLFEFTGEFYRGRAVAGLGGGIGQSVLLNGQFFTPATTFIGLDSMGGWAQLKFKPKTNFEINAALGLDNPFASELRQYESNSIYPALYPRNLTPLVNFIYQVRSDVLFSLEYRHMQTSVLDSGSNSANHINLSLGYIF
jgi:hypothetical protein